MLRTRREILSLLMSSAHETGVSLVKEGARHSHRLTIAADREDLLGQYRGVLLIRSSDWFEYRLNVFGQIEGVQVVVCAEHESCLPVPTWSVEQARLYQPGETAMDLSLLRHKEVRGTRSGSLLLIAALLGHKQEAFEILEDLAPSTRYRYEAKVRTYATLKRGGKLNLQ